MLDKKKFHIAPSILSANFARLEDEVKAITKARADLIHIDVMDGVFVPNLTIGPLVIKAIRSHSTLPFDVHLMIVEPEKHIEAFALSGADIITFHYEAVTHIDSIIAKIRSYNKKVGISIVPSTNEENLRHILPLVDLVLVMSVNPGFGGQKFLDYALLKVKNLSKLIKETGSKALIEVDGGVNPQTARDCFNAGADTLVAGTAVFKGGAKHYQANIAALKAAAG
jgi:ribulose-phosphate 3-epimerase